MNTIFMNSEKSKTSDLHRLVVNLSDIMNLKINSKYVALSNHSDYNTWKEPKNVILK